VLSDPNSDSKAVGKNPLLYSSIVIGIALLWVGWIFFSRWQENRAIEQKTEKERAQKRLENDRATVELLGGKGLAIQMFYACLAVPFPLPRGRPTRTTTYTLTIMDVAGNNKSQTVEVKVH
jgi:hypothetical protein